MYIVMYAATYFHSIRITEFSAISIAKGTELHFIALDGLLIVGFVLTSGH